MDYTKNIDVPLHTDATTKIWVKCVIDAGQFGARKYGFCSHFSLLFPLASNIFLTKSATSSLFLCAIR